MLAHAGEAVVFGGFFTESKVGKTGLTVTVDVYRVALADLTTTQVVTGGSATAIGGGLYAYRHVTTSGAGYYYYAVFKTATTSVDLQHLPAVQIAGTSLTEAVPAAAPGASGGLPVIGSAPLTYLDASVSSRSTYAGADTGGTTTLLSRLTSDRAGYLDRLDAAVSTRLASASYTAPLDAAGVRSAVGLAAANLDTQLGDLPTAAENAAATWAESTRTLTAGTNIVLAKGTGITGFNDLDAAGIRAAQGLAAADLDAQFDGVLSAIAGVSGGGDTSAYSGTLATVTSDGGTLTVAPASSLEGYRMTVDGRTYRVESHTAGQVAFTLDEPWNVLPEVGDAWTADYISGTDPEANRAAFIEALGGTVITVRDLTGVPVGQMTVFDHIGSMGALGAGPEDTNDDGDEYTRKYPGGSTMRKFDLIRGDDGKIKGRE